MFGKKKGGLDPELEVYRGLLETPSQYEEGFTKVTFLGVLFVAFIMVPGNLYLNLMIGGGIGAAAEWVTVILFIEVAKRSFVTLKRQEVYLLLYVATALIGSSGLFTGLLWNQYLVQSPAAKQFGIADLIPNWVSPPATSEAIISRTFLHSDWLPAIGLLLIGVVVGRVSWFCMGYVLFRLTSDVERLPFPFAPIAAQGAMALAESSAGEESWRWRVFSAGAMIGIVFGTLYAALPAITGAILAKPITLLPIPWIDFTQITGNFLPATPLGISTHLGSLFAGFVVPFWAVIGSGIGILLTTIANPILYHYGFFPHWHRGMDTIRTSFVTSIDFWMSFTIGITIAIFFISLYQVVIGLREMRQKGDAGERIRLAPPPGRGDFSIKLCLALYVLCYSTLAGIAVMLLPQFSVQLLVFFVFFALVYTPLISYISARLVGYIGRYVDPPLVREATIIWLSGYRGIDIWFIPFPVANFSGQAAKFREIELTGTRFTSILKAEAVMVPIIVLTSFMYWSYIWKLAPIPSASYPYIQLFWPLQAYQQCVWLTGTFRHEMEETTEQVAWRPANLVGGVWWYWRVRATDGKQDGQWSEVKRFYAGYGERRQGAAPVEEESLIEGMKERVVERPSPVPGNRPPPVPLLVVPGHGDTLRTATPALTVRRVNDPDGDAVQYYVEVDQSPFFDSPWKQTSVDKNWLFEALKPKVMGLGLAIGLGSFIVLSAFGLPIMLIFGYAGSLSGFPHDFVLTFIGALLARYHFWKKYGQQQWLTYATVLIVGFYVGMSLTGMAAVAVAMIQKSVSVLIF
jgi:hypothetical protein